MKKNIFIALFFSLLLFSCGGKQKALILGDSELFTVGDSLHFSDRPLEDFPIVQLFTYKTTIDENKHFQIEIPLKKPGFVSMSSGITFYTAPGDQVNIKVQAQANIVYTGKYANLNNALVNFKISEATLLSPVFEKYFLPETGRLNYEESLLTDLASAISTKIEELSSTYPMSSEELAVFKGAIEGYQKRITFIASLYIAKDVFDLLSTEEKKNLTNIEISIAEAERFPSFLTTVYLKMIEEEIRNNQMQNISITELDEKISAYNLTSVMKDDLYAYSLMMLLNQMAMIPMEDQALEQFTKSAELLISRVKSGETRVQLEEIWKEATSYFNGSANPMGESDDFSFRLAPALELENLNGSKMNLSEFAGKVVYLDFWATWCAPCLEQIPALKKIQAHYKNNSNVVFISVSVDKKEDKKKWKDAVTKHQMQGLNLFAGEDHPGLGSGIEQFDVNVLPSFYLIGKMGELYPAVVPSLEAELIAMIDELLI